MPSTCPKCHAVIEEDEICCAQVRYTWRCKSCFKLTSGLAMPYGKCFLCGGDLEVIPDRDLGDSMRFRAIRDAVQFELDSFHFYKLARDKARTPEQRAVLESLYEAELDHLHELEEKYHAHLDRKVVELSSDEQTLLSNWLFRGINLTEDSGAGARSAQRSSTQWEAASEGAAEIARKSAAHRNFIRVPLTAPPRYRPANRRGCDPARPRRIRRRD